MIVGSQAPHAQHTQNTSPAQHNPGQHDAATPLHDPSLFLNRELSSMAFNERVLDEARNQDLPLYERLKFLSIFSSNLDEFFMVRVAGLKDQLADQLASGVSERSDDGRSTKDVLQAISERAHRLVDEQAKIYLEEIIPLLAENGVYILTHEDLNDEQRIAAHDYFITQVFPTLTPLAVDPAHPFPHLRNKSLNIALSLQRRSAAPRALRAEPNFAVVQMPAVLRRLVPLPCDQGRAYLPLESLIAAKVEELFPGFFAQEASFFRLTRNWDLDIEEDESEDLLSTIQNELKHRDRREAVRLELSASSSPRLEEFLCEALEIAQDDVYRCQIPMHFSDFMALADEDTRSELHIDPYTPVIPPSVRNTESMFDLIRAGDVLLHHPYESFDPVVRFIEEAAEDPNVLAIKQTLYRTSGNSPFVRALSKAAENGKQVAVLIELRARFDEANNIAWARRLEESGVHVVYGLLGLKTHCKLALVVRREGNVMRRYMHIGTGNYNHQTARVYTDLSLFTARTEIAHDASALFNMLTGLSDAPPFRRFCVAPINLRDRVIELIRREAERARHGETGRIVAKLNSLVDPDVIHELYVASQAGCSIDLIVRGICCLRPAVPGISDNIRVISIVDRFLEHSRIYAFGVGEQTDIYIASADWMPRNFVRRVEIMAPVEDPALKNRLLTEVLGLALEDNVKARVLRSDGTYVKRTPDDAALRSQVALMLAAQMPLSGYSMGGVGGYIPSNLPTSLADIPAPSIPRREENPAESRVDAANGKNGEKNHGAQREEKPSRSNKNGDKSSGTTLPPLTDGFDHDEGTYREEWREEWV